MGNWRSLPVPEAYRKAIEDDADLPVGKQSLPVPPRVAEPHPLWYLYEHRLTEWPGGLRKAAKVNEEIAANVSVKSRKVKFDDVLDPYPHVSERHPFFLDYGENIRRANNDATIYRLPPEQIPVRSRRVKFDDILDPDPHFSERHPLLLDYGEGILRSNNDATIYRLRPDQIPVRSRRVKFDDVLDPIPHVSEQHPFLLDYGEGVRRSNRDATIYRLWPEQIPIRSRRVTFDDMLDPQPQYSELHPVFLDYGEGLVRKHRDSTVYRTAAEHISVKCTTVKFILPQDVSLEFPFGFEDERHAANIFQPPTGKMVHFSILREASKQSWRRTTIRKSILKTYDQSKNCITESEKILHESIVLASHLCWSLRKELLTHEDENGEEKTINIVEYLALPWYHDEHHPISYASNREFLVNGCPAFLLNKNPHIDFPTKSQDKCANDCAESAGTEDMIGGDAVDTLEPAADPPEPTVEENQVTVQENLHVAIEPHGHLKQSYFPHLTASTLHKKATATEQKVLLVMQASYLDMDDIQTYLVDVCAIHDIGQKNVQISDVKHFDRKTSCKITFPSGKMARKFKTHMDKIKEITLCHASIWEDVCDANLVQSSLKKRMDTILERSLTVLGMHRAKQEEIRTKLKSTKGKRSLSEINDLLEERHALEQKRQELENQEQEFITFLKIFQDPFLKIAPRAHWQKEATVMEKRYEIETERLHAALPMYAKRSEIVQMIAENQVSILLGETGSGKSTQVTQYLYEAGLAGHKKIVCTQPRKVAATSLAKRVSTEMHSQLGDVVGYKVGMQKHLSEETRILYVTDHILLKECLSDPLLTKYSCVIIDEAHERSLNTDLLLGMIKRALIHRPELRVIITSATINPDVFVAFFNGCPVLKVSGRVFPVEVIYSDEPADPDSNFVQRAVQKALEVALTPEPGDILVFLTTPLETEQACEKLFKMWPNNKRNIMCLALHGKTQGSDQQKVFNPTPDGKRKVVFATNSAETSVTIPGIKVVIDTGLAKEKLYDHKKNMSALKVTKISQSSANQRKGRAGRTERGKCYRLYREEDYNSMDICSKPEIMKVHLGMALLTLLSFNIEDPLSFDFVEMPPREGLEKAMNVLIYLDAVDKDGKLTALGRKLAAMSLEPRMAKLVLNGIDRRIGFESVLIASFSTMGGNMFYRGGSDSQKQQADKLKVRFCNPRGDIHTMLDVYKEWSRQPEKDKNKWCMDNSINAKSLRMVRESVREIQNTLSTDLAIRIHQTFERDEKYMEDMVEAVIFESYAMNLCVYAGHESLGYMTATEPDKLVHVHPSSALKSLAKSPSYMVYENTLTTSRAFVINITCISNNTFKDFCKTGNSMVDLEEINSRITSPCVISDVGTATARKICGAKHSTRLALEKELQVYFHTEMLTLEVNVAQGTVSVYTLPRVKDECHRLVKRMVVREQECLYQEEIERPLVEGFATRVIIEHGLQTKCLLFADEFRSIHIPSVPSQYDAEELIEQFRELAVVTNYESSSTKAKNSRGLRVTFEHCDAAAEVLELLKGTESDELLPGIVAKPDLTGAKGVSVPHVENVNVKITWCRRPNKGIAFVKFARRGDARCAVARMSCVAVQGIMCPIKLSSKNDDELFVRNIPRMLSNNEVSQQIKESIQLLTDYRAKDVVVPNQPPMETSHSDCEQYKRCIQAHIEREAPGVSGIEINMRIPTEKAVQFVAFVALKNWLHAERIRDALQGMTIMGQSTSVNMTLKSFMFVRQEIIHYIRDELETVIGELEVIDGLSCQGKQVNGGHRIDISAQDAEDLSMARTQLAKCIDGIKFDIVKSEHLKYFKYMTKGERFIANVQRQCGVHIIIDQFQSVIILHGRREGITLATQRITKQIKLLMESLTQVFDLKEEFPAGMSKRLMGQFGLDLQGLVRDSGAEMVTLQLRQHLLTVHGSQESVENVRKLLHIQALALTEKMKEKTEQSLPDCPICFCEPDRKEVYRLEYCGHAYCESCIKNTLEHARQDRRFPVQCAKEGCSKGIVMKDVFALVGRSMERLMPFITASVDCYVRTHGAEVKYCITADCNMIYVANRRDVEMCPLCQVKICTKCDSEYHPAINCEMNRLMRDQMGGRTFDQYSRETWLAEDPENRALCPKCNAGIEKNGGCMHMHCTLCSVHICWRCKAMFPTGRDVYNHQQDCLGAGNM